MAVEPNVEAIFVKTKDEIVALSDELYDSVKREPELDGNGKLIYDFDESHFIKVLNTIQSKISILCTLASTSRANLDWLDESSNKLMETVDAIREAERKENPLKYVFQRGVLIGQVRTYSLVINSLRFDLHRKRFRFDLKSLSISHI
jgi:hypothetical protein